MAFRTTTPQPWLRIRRSVADVSRAFSFGTVPALPRGQVDPLPLLSRSTGTRSRRNWSAERLCLSRSIHLSGDHPFAAEERAAAHTDSVIHRLHRALTGGGNVRSGQSLPICPARAGSALPSMVD